MLRGKIISFSVYKKRKKEKKQEAKLNHQIKERKESNASNPTEDTQKELRKSKFKRNEILNRHTQFMIHRFRQEALHHSNKPGKYLANQIRQNKEKATISVIKSTAGKVTSSPEVFYNFYSKIYSSELNPNQEAIEASLLSFTKNSGLIWLHSSSR